MHRTYTDLLQFDLSLSLFRMNLYYFLNLASVYAMFTVFLCAVSVGWFDFRNR